MKRLILFIVLIWIIIMTSCAIFPDRSSNLALKDKIICIDPGHGGTAETDNYRVGPTGEREEWIDLRVALYLKKLLDKRGAKVVLTRTGDVRVPLEDRALLAVQNKADAFLSLHHNATADPRVNFPIIYYHGNASENIGSVILGKCLAKRLRNALFNGKGDVTLCSDYTIFPGGGTSVLRNSYGIPGVIGEGSFFSNPEEEKRLKKRSYNKKEAEAYVLALEDFFASSPLPVLEKFTLVEIPPFEVFREAERMNEIAKRWNEDYEDGKELFDRNDPDSLQKAFDLLTRSAKSFPDSPVARKCHHLRSLILEKWGKGEEALGEQNRLNEFYIPLD